MTRGRFLNHPCEKSHKVVPHCQSEDPHPVHIGDAMFLQ